jgi:hypothetical protein
MEREIKEHEGTRWRAQGTRKNVEVNEDVPDARITIGFCHLSCTFRLSASLLSALHPFLPIP